MQVESGDQLTGGICHPSPFDGPFPGSRQLQSYKAPQTRFFSYLWPWVYNRNHALSLSQEHLGTASRAYQKKSLEAHTRKKKKCFHLFSNLRDNMNFQTEENVLLCILIHLSLCQPCKNTILNIFLRRRGSLSHGSLTSPGQANQEAGR